MDNELNISHQIAQILEWAKRQPEINAIYLFGSQVTETTHPESDLDVAVLVDCLVEKKNLWRLEDRWTTMWDDRTDVCILNLAPVPFKYEVITYGGRVLAKDLNAIALFESVVRRLYWDIQPLLERSWEAFRTHLLEGQNAVERQEYQATLAKINTIHSRA